MLPMGRKPPQTQHGLYIMTTNPEIRVNGNVVFTTPSAFPEAVELLRRDGLTGVQIAEDWLDAQEDAPLCDLSILAHSAPNVEQFSVAPGIKASRLASFDSIYALENLRELGLHQYSHIDVGRFPLLSKLFVRDSKSLDGLCSAKGLRSLTVWGLRSGNLSVLGCRASLEELKIVQASAKVTDLTGLDGFVSLRELEVHHCRSLRSLSAPPPSLVVLKVQACPKMADFSFLEHNESLDFLFTSTLSTLGFLPSMTRITRLGFENVLDGDLSPILRTRTIQFLGFSDKKNYSHKRADLLRALGLEPQA